MAGISCLMKSANYKGRLLLQSFPRGGDPSLLSHMVTATRVVVTAMADTMASIGTVRATTTMRVTIIIMIIIMIITLRATKTLHRMLASESLVGKGFYSMTRIVTEEFSVIQLK